MKRFFITIDTEGDNLWDWREGMDIHTENARFLPRFQTLCEEYDLKPTYLSNFEMISDSFFRDFAGNKQAQIHSPPEMIPALPISLNIRKIGWRKKSPS